MNIKIGGTQGKSFEFNDVESFAVTNGSNKSVVIKKDGEEYNIVLTSAHVVIRIDD